VTVPTRRLALVLFALLPLALAPALVSPAWGPAWAGALVLAVGAALVDLVLAPPPARLQVEVAAPADMIVGDPRPARVTVGAPGWAWPVPLAVLLDLDGDVLPARSEVAGRAIPGAPARVEVELAARCRGTGQVEAAWVRWTGPLGLVQNTLRKKLDLAVRVGPDLRPVREAALRFSSRREFLVGSKVQRHVGEGSEFEALREYVPGFDRRAIDWKASARRRKLMAREYRPERDHRVLVAIDAGYMMAEPIGGVPRLDHAISAGLLLAYVALRTGDRVGLAAFDEKPRLYLEPRSGNGVYARLRRGATGIAYTRAETNFALGMLHLTRRLDRRSLVVVLTDFADPVGAALMLDALGRLARRHLVLFVALRDTQLETTAEARPRRVDDLGRAVVARDLIRERESVLERLRIQGIHCLDAAPGPAANRAVRRYLDIRRRELV
jgi:uncharacterized protein (DUF58 family)